MEGKEKLPGEQGSLLTVLVHRPENFDRLRRPKRQEIEEAIDTLHTAVLLLVNPFTSHSAKEECIRIHARKLTEAASLLSKRGATVLFPVNFQINCPLGHTIPYEEDELKSNRWMDYGPEYTRAPHYTTIRIGLGGHLHRKKTIVVKNSVKP